MTLKDKIIHWYRKQTSRRKFLYTLSGFKEYTKDWTKEKKEYLAEQCFELEESIREQNQTRKIEAIRKMFPTIEDINTASDAEIEQLYQSVKRLGELLNEK